MKKFYIPVLAFFILSACKKEVQQPVVKAVAKDTANCKKPADGKKFVMYEMSELASLMEQMYAENLQLKDRIKNGQPVGEFPKHIVKIHSAAMTDPSENDAFFKEQAAKFIAAQEQIYKDPANAQKHFNDGVTACIKCHEGKCEGPIPRIKKLYIK
jgi:cytochrome c553